MNDATLQWWVNLITPIFLFLACLLLALAFVGLARMEYQDWQSERRKQKERKQ